MAELTRKEAREVVFQILFYFIIDVYAAEVDDVGEIVRNLMSGADFDKI
jgi:hypothetical protein